MSAHPEVEIIGAETVFARFLRMDVIEFRHRLYSGEWSAPHRWDVLRRDPAAAVVLYDPDRDCVVLVEQLRLPALLAGGSSLASPRLRLSAHRPRVRRRFWFTTT